MKDNHKRYLKYAAIVIVTLMFASCVFGGDDSASSVDRPSYSATHSASATVTPSATSTPSASTGAYAPSYVMQAAWEGITSQQRQDIRTGWELSKLVGADAEKEFIAMFRANVTQIESDREARQFLDWTLDN